MQLPRIKSYREFLETYKSGVGADAVSAQKRKKAGVEYARSKSTYGARAESLAEAGLSRSGYADYLAVLPASYRDLPAASYFLTAVRDGRADDMKEAMNLYEQQLHNWKMEKAFEDMTKLQKYQNQFISDALNEIQRNQEVIHSDLSAIMTMQAVDLIAK